MTSAEVRESARARLARLSADPHLAQKQNALKDRALRVLADLLGTHPRPRVGFYVPLPEEPPVLELARHWWDRGAELYFPKVVGRELQFTRARSLPVLDSPHWTLGSLKILEPKEPVGHLPLDQLDLVLVPGLAFDLTGGRVGRGMGFYDRALAGCRNVRRVALAFEEQLFETLPLESWDQPVDLLVTDARTLEPWQGRRGQA